MGVTYARRIVAEETLLRRELPGYATYAERTKRWSPRSGRSGANRSSRPDSLPLDDRSVARGVTEVKLPPSVATSRSPTSGGGLPGHPGHLQSQRPRRADERGVAESADGAVGGDLSVAGAVGVVAKATIDRWPGRPGPEPSVTPRRCCRSCRAGAAHPATSRPPGPGVARGAPSSLPASAGRLDVAHRRRSLTLRREPPSLVSTSSDGPPTQRGARRPPRRTGSQAGADRAPAASRRRLASRRTSSGSGPAAAAARLSRRCSMLLGADDRRVQVGVRQREAQHERRAAHAVEQLVEPGACPSSRASSRWRPCSSAGPPSRRGRPGPRRRG